MASKMSTEDYSTINLTPNPSPPRKKHHTKTSSDHVNMEEGLVQAPGPGQKKKTKTWDKSTVVTMVILILLQLQDNIDSLMVMASLSSIKAAFNFTTTQAESSSVVYIISFGLLVPLFGAICDCCNKACIIRFGVLFQVAVSILTSFIQERKDPILTLIYFMISRVLSSASHASYSTIPNSIIGHLFHGNQRTWMLAIYQIAGIIGIGMAYIIHNETTKATDGDWRWGLRFSAAFSLLTIYFVNFIKFPPMENTKKEGCEQPTIKSCFCSFLGLWKNCSLMFSILGLTSLRFVEQVVTLWIPEFFIRAREEQDQECQSLLCQLDVENIFGIFTIISAILGVFIGVIICHKLREVDPDADPMVCAMSLIASVPILYLCFSYAEVNLAASYILLFFALVLLNVASIITASMTLYVVSPATWCCADALESFFSHLLGTLPGTFFIAVQQDLFCQTWPHLREYHCIKFSLMICGLVTAVGGVFYIITAFVIGKDRQKYKTTS